MINGAQSERLGRMVFDRFCVQLNRILDRMGYTDEIVYGTELEHLLTEMCCRGFSPRKVIDTLMMLDGAGIINMEQFSQRSNY